MQMWKMSRIFGIFSIVFLLAASVIAPVNSAYAATKLLTAPMMQMQDGSAGCPKECKTMPDCPMAFVCAPGVVAVQVSAVMTIIGSDHPPDGFPLQTAVVAMSLGGDGLRRPPKL